MKLKSFGRLGDGEKCCLLLRWVHKHSMALHLLPVYWRGLSVARGGDPRAALLALAILEGELAASFVVSAMRLALDQADRLAAV